VLPKGVQMEMEHGEVRFVPVLVCSNDNDAVVVLRRTLNTNDLEPSQRRSSLA